MGFDSSEVSVLEIASRSDRSPRKLAVLNTAIALFAERGYDRVTIRDIGDELGMTSASLYRHYKAKSAVLADAFELVVQSLIAGLTRICRQRLAGLERLESAVRFHVEFAMRHRIYLRVYYLEANHLDDADRAIHRRRANAYRALWVGLLMETRAATSHAEAEQLYAMAMAMINVGSTSRLQPAAPELLIERTLTMFVGSDRHDGAAAVASAPR